MPAHAPLRPVLRCGLCGAAPAPATRGRLLEKAPVEVPVKPSASRARRPAARAAAPSPLKMATATPPDAAAAGADRQAGAAVQRRLRGRREGVQEAGAQRLPGAQGPAGAVGRPQAHHHHSPPPAPAWALEQTSPAVATSPSLATYNSCTRDPVARPPAALAFAAAQPHAAAAIQAQPTAAATAARQPTSSSPQPATQGCGPTPCSPASGQSQQPGCEQRQRQVAAACSPTATSQCWPGSATASKVQCME